MIIGLISAMPSETVDVRAALGECTTKKIGKNEFFIYNAFGKTIVNVCCGIGKVNAAIAAQMLLSEFHCDVLLNAGIAGGMDSSVKICDIVVASEVLHHDMEARLLNNYPPYCSAYPCDAELVQKAESACTEKGISYHVGRVVSGEQFISDSAVKNKIAENFHPLSVEMECAAIGHCAYVNEVPFLAVKCISDNADDEGEMSFEEFEKIAAAKVAEVILSVMENLG